MVAWMDLGTFAEIGQPADAPLCESDNTA